MRITYQNAFGDLFKVHLANTAYFIYEHRLLACPCFPPREELLSRCSCVMYFYCTVLYVSHPIGVSIRIHSCCKHAFVTLLSMIPGEVAIALGWKVSTVQYYCNGEPMELKLHLRRIGALWPPLSFLFVNSLHPQNTPHRSSDRSDALMMPTHVGATFLNDTGRHATACFPGIDDSRHDGCCEFRVALDG